MDHFLKAARNLVLGKYISIDDWKHFVQLYKEKILIQEQLMDQLTESFEHTIRISHMRG